MRWFWYTAICLAAVGLNAHAGSVGQALSAQINASAADDDVAVIVYFSKAKNLSPHKRRLRDFFYQQRITPTALGTRAQQRETRRRLRAEFINALRLDAARSQRNVKNALRSLKRPVKRELWLLNAMAVDIPAGAVATIAALPKVERIELDREIQLSTFPMTGGAVPTWNLDNVRVPAVWQLGITGAGATVATMDSGVDGEHPDLSASWRGGSNSWFDAYGQYSQPHDGNGHGTQTMGVMVGGAASGVAIGVAPDAQWIAAKIFRDDMTASLSAIHAGFQWILDPDNDSATDDAPDVVNNSWGIPYNSNPDDCDTEFHDDIDALLSAGISVVFAAGNDGPTSNTLLSPGDYDQVVSVGAVDQFYNAANFSSRGPSNCSGDVFPKLSAPGTDIYTSDLSFGLGLTLDPYNPSAYGTSFAAPHVAAIIALIKSDQPSMAASEIKAALLSTAVDYGDAGADDAFGYGVVDAYAAVLRARCPAGDDDSDGDGWYSVCDNCTQVANTQIDTDGDGFGNACDADFDNSGSVTTIDIAMFIDALNNQNPAADFNGDGLVNTQDVAIFIGLFGRPPGPSGVAN